MSGRSLADNLAEYVSQDKLAFGYKHGTQKNTVKIPSSTLSL